MQIFLPYIEPIEVAKTLDSRRLNKQIIECDWILDAEEKNTRSQYHPIYKMYKDNLDFVLDYKMCLDMYRLGFISDAELFNKRALLELPDFLKDADWYFDNFKSRLFTKDNAFYKKFEKYGKSYTNYYFVDGKWKKYENN